MKIRIKFMFTSVVTVLLFAALPISVFAGTGFYVIDSSVRSGMIVSLTDNPGVVRPASRESADKTVGVIGMAVNDFDIKEGQVAVQTSGVVETLVSTVEGDIKIGDRIHASVLNGVGARLNSSGWVIGTAQASLDASSKDATTTTVTDASGGERQVIVAKIPVLIEVMYVNQSGVSVEVQGNSLPKPLQTIADSIAGKHASILAVIIASILLLVGLIVSGIILYSTVRSGIVALGRQPLAKNSIVAGMIRTTVTAFFMLVAAVVGAFLVLRLL